MRKFLIFTFISIVFFACKKGNESYEGKYANLKLEVSKNINSPFINNYEDIIYEQSIGVCGNSTKEELERIFIPNLDESKECRKILKANLNRKVWFTADKDIQDRLDLILDSIPESDRWGYFYRNKPRLHLTGWINSDSLIDIYEEWIMNDSVVRIEKCYHKLNNDWNQKLSDTVGFSIRP